MARRGSGISSKQFFTMTVLAVSALGLIFITSAAQKPTNTKSDASTCTNSPSWKFIGTTDYRTHIVYHLTLTNNCPGDNNFVLKVMETPTQPRLYTGWDWKFANGEWNTRYIKPNVLGNAEVNLTVGRPGYSIGPNDVKAMYDGKYYWVKVKASLADNPSASDTISLYYNVGNP